MSKGTQTFADKQRKFTDAEVTALEHLRKKNAGIAPKPKTVLTAKDIELQDKGALEPKKTYEYEEGKLITAEVLAKEVEDKKKEDERFTKEFRRQLGVWVKEDHHSEYENVEFDHEDYLVRIFQMDVSSFKNFITLEYEWSPILQKLKLTDKPATENVFPIVKLLKIGGNIKLGKYKVGDICLVPSTDVIGEDWNPKFLQIMQFQNSQNMKPIIPDGMRQSIPNVEKNWDRYKFIRPWTPLPEQIDHLTFLLPEAKVRGSYSGF